MDDREMQPFPSSTKAKASLRGNLGHKALLSGASNLANLLPTGTVLLFQALLPAFSRNGKCLPANYFLTWFLIGTCTIICFLHSFTDSFVDTHGNLYYGFATLNGFYVFNDGQRQSHHDLESNNGHQVNLQDYKLTSRDVVHACISTFVFLTITICSQNVIDCLFGGSGENFNQLTLNLPLVTGIVANVVFTLFPTTRQGIGSADISPQSKR